MTCANMKSDSDGLFLFDEKKFLKTTNMQILHWFDEFSKNIFVWLKYTEGNCFVYQCTVI